MKRLFIPALLLLLILCDNLGYSQVEIQEETSVSLFEIDDGIKPINSIDEFILANLKERQLQPALLCSDSVFIRRLYVDLLGRIPTPQEVIRFLQSQENDKRAQLINELLDSERFNDYQALRWADLLRIKSEFPINLWPNGATIYHRWLLESIRQNQPYDQFVRTLLTSSGSNFRNGPCNFYRAIQMRDADSIAETVAQVFMNVQTDRLSESERKNLGTFFSRVAYKGTAQWKEEIVYWDRRPLENKEVIFPDGSRQNMPKNKDPREVFADWLIQPDNKAFHYTIVNRLWSWLFGHGFLLTSSDNMMETQSLCPKLPEFLTQELISHQYDLKHIYRLILNSRTYQQSALQKIHQEEAEKYFAVYPVRRLEAEVLQDSFIQIFDLQITYRSETPEPYSYLPGNLQTIQLADAGITSSFLEMFGRATRDTGSVTDRNNEVSASQELYLLNSNEINQRVQKLADRYLRGPEQNTNQKQKPNQKQKQSNSKQIQEPWNVPAMIWLTFLSRYPSEAERKCFQEESLKGKRLDKKGVGDVIWTLINSKEFLCQH